MSGSTGEQPAVTPTVSTAPARSRWSKLPSHLGRARTSTLVLGALFLAIGALYLNIRPEVPSSTTTTSETGIEQEQEPVPVVPTTPASETTADPTTEAPETTEAPAPSAEPTPTTDESTPTTTAPRTTEPLPTTSPAPSLPTSPTTVSGPG